MWSWGADHNQSFGSSTAVPGRETECIEPTCPGADVGILIDSAQPTYLYGTNSEHHVETSYRLGPGSHVVVAMAQNEYRSFGPSGPGSAMCRSKALEVQGAAAAHVFGLSACSWKCRGPGTQEPLVSVGSAENVSFTGLYAACVKDERGVCYMLGAEANDTRFGMGAHHVVAVQWSRLPTGVP